MNIPQEFLDGEVVSPYTLPNGDTVITYPAGVTVAEHLGTLPPQPEFSEEIRESLQARPTVVFGVDDASGDETHAR